MYLYLITSLKTVNKNQPNLERETDNSTIIAVDCRIYYVESQFNIIFSATDETTTQTQQRSWETLSDALTWILMEH